MTSPGNRYTSINIEEVSLALSSVFEAAIGDYADTNELLKTPTGCHDVRVLNALAHLSDTAIRVAGGIEQQLHTLNERMHNAVAAIGGTEENHILPISQDRGHK